jgi:hypothetical protein
MDAWRWKSVADNRYLFMEQVIMGLIEQPGHYAKLNGGKESTPEEYIKYAGTRVGRP